MHASTAAMWSLPRRALSSVADFTIGTAIVMVHVLMFDRTARIRAEAERKAFALVRERN